MTAGRKRSFDKQQALDAAMKVFWLKGYVGASLADLTESMGINKPSMYAAFGNKEQLFIQAIQIYVENYASGHAKLLSEEGKTTEQQLRAYLLSILKSQCGQCGPKGCYISVCVSEAGSEELPIEANVAVDQVKFIGEQVLEAFFIQAQNKNTLSHDISASHLAQYYNSLLHGTAAMARAGKTLSELTAVVDVSLMSLKSLLSYHMKNK